MWGRLVTVANPRADWQSDWQSAQPARVTNASPPAWSMRRNQMSPSMPGALRVEWNASSLPSGLHCGTDALKARLVSRTGGMEPSEGLIQISVWRSFSASMIELRTKTTQRPSGEIAVAEALSMR